MDWSYFLTVPTITALVAIIAATVTDIKVHEVPDWVSYSLVALGLLYALADTLLTKQWTLAYSLLGLAVGYGIGALLYYTGQWGGGDAKLLMGLGATLTLPWFWFIQLIHDPALLMHPLTMPFFLRFIGLMVVCGAVYGLVWMAVLIIKRFEEFKAEFRKELARMKTYRIIVLVAVAACLVLAVLARENTIVSLLVVLLAALVYGSFYLMVAVRIAEKQFMLRPIKAKQLTEGDWVVGGVRLGKEWIIPADNIGATREQIAVLVKRAPNQSITIKEGIPFVPSFLAAFLIALL